MYSMNKEQRALLEKRKKSKRIKQLVIVCACALVAVGAVTAVFLAMQPPTARATIDSAGNLTIPAAQIGGELTYIRYRGGKDLIAYTDAGGTVRTAFNTCEECYPSGNSTYTQSGGNLVCSYCRTSIALSTLGTASWGGCQPVSVPVELRADTQDQVVIPAAVLDYAATVFSAWDAGDYSQSVGNYAA